MAHAQKLSEVQIKQIPKLLEQGVTISAIARMFSVTPAAVRGVIVEEKWKRYTDEPPGEPDRCPDCGAMVLDDTQPCRGCMVKRLKEGQKTPQKLALTQFGEAV
jgi:hypothetical protein